jgi:hypothetical protein
MGTNCGPVSKKPERSQMFSNVQSRATGRVQCPLPRRRRSSAARRRMFGPSTSAGSGPVWRWVAFDGCGDVAGEDDPGDDDGQADAL